MNGRMDSKEFLLCTWWRFQISCGIGDWDTCWIECGKVSSYNHSNSIKKKLNSACITCPEAKQTFDSFPISDNIASRIFDLIHYDLWGPYANTQSFCVAHYFFTIVDNFSRVVWVYVLRNKIEVSIAFHSFLAMVEH